jgi:putative RecB family exonuclease
MASDPPKHLSPTSWATWEQCPLRFRLRYIEHLADPAGPAAAVGTFAHAVLEHLYDLEPPRRTLGAAKEQATGLWATMAGDKVCDSLGVHPRMFKRAVMNGVVGDFELEDPTAVEVHSTEHRHEWTEGDTPMVCVIDRVDRNPRDSLNPGLTVSDYKTGSVPTRADAMAKAHRQIAVNGLAVRDIEGPLAVARQGALLYTTAEHVEPVLIGPDVLDQTADEAQETWGAILAACDTDEFPANPGPLCPFCSYVGVCPDGQAQTRRSFSWKNPPPEDAAGVVALRMLEAS